MVYGAVGASYSLCRPNKDSASCAHWTNDLPTTAGCRVFESTRYAHIRTCSKETLYSVNTKTLYICLSGGHSDSCGRCHQCHPINQAKHGTSSRRCESWSTCCEKKYRAIRRSAKRDRHRNSIAPSNLWVSPPLAMPPTSNTQHRCFLPEAFALRSDAVDVAMAASVLALLVVWTRAGRTDILSKAHTNL